MKGNNEVTEAEETVQVAEKPAVDFFGGQTTRDAFPNKEIIINKADYDMGEPVGILKAIKKIFFGKDENKPQAESEIQAPYKIENPNS